MVEVSYIRVFREQTETNLAALFEIYFPFQKVSTDKKIMVLRRFYGEYGHPVCVGLFF